MLKGWKVLEEDVKSLTICFGSTRLSWSVSDASADIYSCTHVPNKLIVLRFQLKHLKNAFLSWELNKKLWNLWAFCVVV